MLKKIYRRLTERHWTIGILDYTPDIIQNKEFYPEIHWVKNSFHDSWIADPFILDVTETDFVVLVEEFPYATRKGRISKVIVDKLTYEVISIKTLLEIDTHLSFPSYFEFEGKIYVYPENIKGGRQCLYVYNKESDRLDFVKEINTNSLADAIIWKLKCGVVLSATTSPNDNKNILDIYPYDNRKKIFDNKSKFQITFPANTARNAGFAFEEGGLFVRPAQDCTNSYGECVVLQKVIESENKIQFEEIRRLYSRHPQFELAFHTFNIYKKRYVIVDAQGFRYRKIARLIYKVKKILGL